MTPPRCSCCDDTRWVCEAHPDQPYEGPHACMCGCTAGMPCPVCCKPDGRGVLPPVPDGFEPDHG
ncbi:hypothetical protein AB7M47_004950 [Bradyrhizobium elkanii]